MSLPDRRFTIAGAFIACLAVAGLAFMTLGGPAHPPTGWAGPEVVAEAAPIVAGMPDFRLKHDHGVEGVRQDNSRKRVLLFDAMRKVLRGRHLTNTRQEIGDCVSWGWRNAISYLLAVAVVTGDAAEFQDVYPPYIYGTSRVQVGGGRLGNSDGSIGAWAAKAVQDYGVLSTDADGVPSYSGSIAKSWGYRGAPREFVDIAQEFRVRTVSPIRSASECRDAICNGYPVPICSNFGTRNFDQRDGRLVARGDGSWNHCMCLIAYDGSASQPYFYCLNSWGPKAHPQPLNGEPPGGFWITWDQAEYILRQGDSFAVSNFRGFKARDIDFNFLEGTSDEMDYLRNSYSTDWRLLDGSGDCLDSEGPSPGRDLRLQFSGRNTERRHQRSFAGLIRLFGDDGATGLGTPLRLGDDGFGRASSTSPVLHSKVLRVVSTDDDQRISQNGRFRLADRTIAIGTHSDCGCGCRSETCSNAQCEGGPCICSDCQRPSGSETRRAFRRSQSHSCDGKSEATGGVLLGEEVKTHWPPQPYQPTPDDDSPGPMGWIPPSPYYGESLFGPSKADLEGLADRAVDRAAKEAKEYISDHKGPIVGYSCLAIGGGGLLSALVVAFVQGVMSFVSHTVLGVVRNDRDRKA